MIAAQALTQMQPGDVASVSYPDGQILEGKIVRVLPTLSIFIFWEVTERQYFEINTLINPEIQVDFMERHNRT